MVGDAYLPSANILADLDPKGTADYLVTEADADNTDAAAFETPPRILSEADDPIVVVICGVLRAADEDGVDRLGVRVRVRVIYNVVRRELEYGREGLGWL